MITLSAHRVVSLKLTKVREYNRSSNGAAFYARTLKLKFDDGTTQELDIYSNTAKGIVNKRK